MDRTRVKWLLAEIEAELAGDRPQTTPTPPPSEGFIRLGLEVEDHGVGAARFYRLGTPPATIRNDIAGLVVELLARLGGVEWEVEATLTLRVDGREVTRSTIHLRPRLVADTAEFVAAERLVEHALTDEEAA